MQQTQDHGDGISARSLFDFDLTRIPDYGLRYGLWFPRGPLDAAILRIARANSMDGLWDENALMDIASYYLFYPVLVAMQFQTIYPNYYPFRNFPCPLPDAVARGNRAGLQILLAGCGSEETGLAGYEMVTELFGKENLQCYEVIDICSISVRRVSEFFHLAGLAPTVKFQAKVERIEHMRGHPGYDVIITDRLLGGSSHDDYDIDILRHLHRRLRKGGMIITTVEAAHRATLPAGPQVPGRQCYRYFCDRYGESEGRDAKIGLTREQWERLTRRYHRIMACTYFSNGGQWRIRNAAHVVHLFRAAGIDAPSVMKAHFGDEVIWEDLDTESEHLSCVDGSLVVCAAR